MNLFATGVYIMQNTKVEKKEEDEGAGEMMKIGKGKRRKSH